MRLAVVPLMQKPECAWLEGGILPLVGTGFQLDTTSVVGCFPFVGPEGDGARSVDRDEGVIYEVVAVTVFSRVVVANAVAMDRYASSAGSVGSRAVAAKVPASIFA